ncbi:putative ribonuclease H-like domain-containing protein [Tanacetum coccineum]|uniref:Ribonuclease H-like domain-containing protein n=1 Tax=Tanacetum coccineum TaxID=301880 RepID=A0ABQ5C743_9ASTR
MEVKSAFLYGKIEEEVYVCQPSGFEDPQEHDDILLVQVYVDDIIFRSTKKEMSTEFEKLMHDKFQISSIGELSFFLGLQVQQKSDAIFISQDKYVAEILKKFDFASVKIASTLMEINKALIKDEKAEDVDVHLYRSMIGSLMYLTTSRLDIMFAVCACARFQVTPKTSHFNVVKRIFRYLKDQPKLGLWYPRDSPFDLEAFSDSNYARASLDKKSTTGVGVEAIHKELGDRMERAATTASSLEAEQDSGSGPRCQDTILGGVDAQTSTLENETMEITATIDGRFKTITEASVRKHLKLEDSNGIPTLPNAEFFEQLSLMGYASDSDKLTFQKGRFSPQWRKNLLLCPHDSSQPRVQSLGSDEGSLTLNKLTVLCTTLSKKVENLQNDLKQTKLTYGAAYTKLILRVKKLEHRVKASKSRRRTKIVVSDDEEVSEDLSKQGRKIAEIDQNPSISLVQDKGTSWIQEDAETQGRTSADTEILLDQEEPTELVEDPGSGEKGKKEISTAEVPVSTASAIPVVSTVIPERQVYIRRSAEKRKDKGKAIMKDNDFVQKKTKKQLE